MSIWGVANPFPLAQSIVPVGDITLASGVETLIATTTALVAARGASAYPVVDLSIAVKFGAVPPSALVLAARLTGGSDFATYTVVPALILANQTIPVTAFFVGTSSRSTWQSPGTQIEITGLSTGQATTANLLGFSCRCSILLGND